MLKRGELIYLTEGEYSDYQVMMVAIVTKDFDEKELVVQFKDEHKDSTAPHYDNETNFLNWLVANRYITEVPVYKEFYLGGYGGLSVDVRGRDSYIVYCSSCNVHLKYWERTGLCKLCQGLDKPVGDSV